MIYYMLNCGRENNKCQRPLQCEHKHLIETKHTDHHDQAKCQDSKRPGRVRPN